MKTVEFRVGDKVMYCDDDGFGVETVLDVAGSYIMTDRTKKLEGWDKWCGIDDYKLVI